MNANAGVNEIVLLGNFDCAIKRAWAVACSDAKDVGDTGFTGTSNHLLAILVETRPV